MRNHKSAFTLIELLVVIAIIAILAAILFPVFAQAKAAAKKISCMSNFNQMAKAMLMYNGDFDDRMPHSNSDGRYPGGGGCWGCGPPNSPNDKTWGLLVQPYVKNYHVYRCTADPNANDRGLSYGPFGNAVSSSDPNIGYYWTARTNLGYNYDFLAPWLYGSAGGQTIISSMPIGLSQVQTTSRTFLFADSIWDRTASGAPDGGGNWVVEAPCIRDSNGQIMEPLFSIQPPANPRWYNYGVGWAVNSPNSWLVFGGLWAWHGGRANMSFLDGHSTSQTISQIARGCDVRANFAGGVYNREAYQWDLE